jgi:SAM-dependent methyltransferase
MHMQAEVFYDASSGYHVSQLAVGEFAFGLIARERARKIGPYIGSDHSVFEYGAGTGLNLAALVCRRRVGYDIATHLSGQLAMRNIEFAPDYSLLPDASFDVVLCHHALEHVPDPSQALRQMFWLLRPGGRLLLYVPFEKERRYRQFDRQEPNHHLYSWNVQTLGNLAEASGFELQSAECGSTGYERWGALLAERLGLKDAGYQSLLTLARAVRRPEEVRLIARRPVQR